MGHRLPWILVGDKWVPVTGRLLVCAVNVGLAHVGQAELGLGREPGTGVARVGSWGPNLGHASVE